MPPNEHQIQQSLVQLCTWFEQTKRHLPWREKPSPYRVWVSEIMLQQTQVSTVIPYFERFMQRFPHLEDLASSSLEDVLPLWAGLGYYRRAEQLLECARLIGAEAYFPNTRSALEALPGIGPYTAGAILSIAFDQPEALLDTNVTRVFTRVFGERASAYAKPAGYTQALWAHAEHMLHLAQRLALPPRVLNQAWMELGASLCQAHQALCDQCPLQHVCQSKANPLALPEKKPRPTTIIIEEDSYALVWHQCEILLEHIPPGAWRAGLWDLPAQSPHTSDAQCLASFAHKYSITNHRITRHVHPVLVTAKPALLPEQAWVPLDAITLPLSSAAQACIRKLQKCLQQNLLF